ncbi:MAG: DUF2971 domain-containing protein [Gallionella sp.]
MRLYKYFHPDRIDVLRNGTIRFSSPKVFNDPFELKPHISSVGSKDKIEAGFETQLQSILTEQYAKLPAQQRKQVSLEQLHKLAKDKLPEFKVELQKYAEIAVPIAQQIIYKTFEEMIGILCLTESPENLLMWAHYASSHQGFVVEFDINSPFFDQRKNSDDEFRHLRKVIYREERPSLVLSEVEDFAPFLTKGVEWSYETEWRMMLPLTSADVVIGEGATAVHLYKFPISAIRSVILGCRISETNVREIHQLIASAEELKDVSCLQAQLDETHYRLILSESRLGRIP